MAVVKLEPLYGEVVHESTMVANVLKEFTDIMPLKLPKTLPLRRGMYHHIIRVKSEASSESNIPHSLFRVGRAQEVIR